MSDTDGQQRERVLESLRAFAAASSEVGRLFARTRQMHHTDAAAIVEILNAEQRGQPLTPARLAERVMLTAGATSTLLNRLEAAGHVVRTREHSDRRVVTLHSTEAIHTEADAFFAPLAERLDDILLSHSARQLETVLEVVTSLSAALTAATATSGTLAATD